ncbi:hypothetical protein FACS1894189_2310 [Planctomycetales bacterium]|nr:hypothetical protein FACS1894189_2310 [Planctomycetales bacterium]
MRILLLIVTLMLAGCSDRITVTGTVRFEDGAPLERGVVMMESDATRASGKIDKNGRFSVGELRDGGGTLPGHYDVWITSTVIEVVGDGKTPSDAVYGGNARPQKVRMENLIPGHLGNRSRSGLSFDVTRDKKEYNIQIPRPGKK